MKCTRCVFKHFSAYFCKMLPVKRLTKEEALKKIKHNYSYQERCHNEVKDKLFGYGLRKADADEIISNLIENNYLNEERFAKLFAGGKFRMKHWGRKKILYELQQKGVNKVNIALGLKEIDGEEYVAAIKKLVKRKWKELSGSHHIAKQAKTYAYLLQKGYEPELISSAIAEVVKGEK